MTDIVLERMGLWVEGAITKSVVVTEEVNMKSHSGGHRGGEHEIQSLSELSRVTIESMEADVDEQKARAMRFEGQELLRESQAVARARAELEMVDRRPRAKWTPARGRGGHRGG